MRRQTRRPQGGTRLAAPRSMAYPDATPSRRPHHAAHHHRSQRPRIRRCTPRGTGVRPPHQGWPRGGRHGRGALRRRRGHHRGPHRRRVQSENRSRPCAAGHRRGGSGGDAWLHRQPLPHPVEHRRPSPVGELPAPGYHHPGGLAPLGCPALSAGRLRVFPGDGAQHGVLRRPHVDPPAGDGHGRPGAHPRGDGADEGAGGRVHAPGSDGAVHGPPLRAGQLRPDGGDHRAGEGRRGLRRYLRDPHAQRRRRAHRIGGRGHPHRRRGRDPGPDQPSQGDGRWPVGRERADPGHDRLGQCCGAQHRPRRLPVHGVEHRILHPLPPMVAGGGPGGFRRARRRSGDAGAHRNGHA